MRIFLVRHPRPGIASGICYGRNDVAVDGQELERAVAGLLPRLPRALPVFSSPLQRCRGLADRLAKELDCAPPKVDGRLSEVDFGRWEMRAWDDIARREIDAWAADVAEYRPGGGESIVEVVSRVHGFLCDLRADVRRRGHGEVLLVCHAGVIRIIQAWRDDCDAHAIALAAADLPAVAYGGVVVCDLQ